MTLARSIPAAAALLLSTTALADTYGIDDDHSSVIFRAVHLGVGYTYGRFNDVSGSFEWGDGAPTQLTLVIKADSVDSDNEKRDKHLRGPDFFESASYPEITFTAATFKKTGEGAYTATGTLTMHGVSEELTVPLEVIGEGTDPWGGYRAGVHASFSVNRSDFGMTYMLEGISDKIDMTVSLEGIRQ